MIARILLILTAIAVLSPANAQDKKVICFVGHKTSHGFGAHEYNAGNHLIGEWLDKAFPGQTESRYSVNWPENPDQFFADADTVIIFCSGGGGHLVNKHVESFDKLMKSGVGLACLHYGVEAPKEPTGRKMLKWMGGYFEKDWSVNPHWVAEFNTFPDHPAARGIKPFKADDEWYFHMRFVDGMKGVTPILSAVAPKETMKRPDGPHSGNPAVRKAVEAGEPQHVAWTYQRGKDYKDGRGFGFTGLHYHWNWEDDSFRKTVLNGVAWTAKLEIPKDGVNSKKPTREELEANALEHGGAQNKKKKSPPKKAAAGKPKAKPLYESPTIAHSNPESHSVDIDVALPGDSRELVLVISDAGDGFSHDWAAWAEPHLVLADGSKKKLTELDWKSASSGFGKPNKNANNNGGPIKVRGKVIENGIGAHANSVIVFDLPKGVKKFKARGVLDDGGTVRGGSNKTPTSVRFAVFNSSAGTGGGSAADDYVKKSSAPGRDAGDAVGSLTVHPDLDVQLFASEPMTLSPSSIDVDHLGRVWVCEVVNYRRNQGKRPEGDRILILADTDGDGKADKSTVFYQGADVDSAHGICVLGDRVIISAGDDIFSLYDRDGDGKADEGSKELMFTKTGGKQHDHGIHAVHFGPDGRLYFNFGNGGKQLHDAKGNIVIDKAGNEVRAGNMPYQEGMVFRCDLDGSNVETLGWNFRNNWEIGVDSFGSIWQSDNDDDGNKGVRINQVLEFGNYGYKDEITRAGWRDLRPGIEEEIPLRHWHLNDPGVVPNLIQTGAGSPTGICVYEGNLLPEIFRGQPIHCDAGPNVVRAYITKPYGAGYSAEMLNILKNTSDRWFRPSDVCVAPDGSLIVADWYDPGVGGHAMGDIERGRIFRVTTPSHKAYSSSKASLNSPEEAVKALRSPNEAARYLAWTTLVDMGGKAKLALKKTFANESLVNRQRARALWLLARLDAEETFSALTDKSSDIRITALRAIRQLYPDRVLEACEKLAGDKNAQVRREVAIAVRFLDTEKANQIWAKLASQLEGDDRWGLEALGIGADLFWDKRLAALENPSSEIIWRSRGKNSAQQIADVLIADPKVGEKYVRALHFQADKEAQKAAYEKLFQKGVPEYALFAAGQLGADSVKNLDGGQARLDALLAPIRGKAEFVKLAEKLNLTGFPDELAGFISANPNAAESVIAARLLLRNRGKLSEYLRDAKDAQRASAIARALGKTGDRSVGGLLVGELKRKQTASPLKIEIVNALAMNGRSGRELLKIAQSGQLDDGLKPVAALAFARSPDAGLRNEAAKILPVPKAAGAENFPSLAEIVKKKGDAKKGAELFAKATCNTCHRVKGQGIDFGPDLSQIGNKLSREAMFESILYPSVGISHGFHGVSVTKKDGVALVGYITGETDGELQLRLPGGVDQNVPKKDIAKRTDLEQSLMPPGLAAVVGLDGLVDLVTWLQTLK